jgi:hypothetical protein
MRPFSLHERTLTDLDGKRDIAWDYLEQTSQTNDPEFTSWLLLDTVEHMVRCGERRRLALSNGAITTYERLRAERLVA